MKLKAAQRAKPKYQAVPKKAALSPAEKSRVVNKASRILNGKGG